MSAGIESEKVLTTACSGASLLMVTGREVIKIACSRFDFESYQMFCYARTLHIDRRQDTWGGRRA